MRGLRRKDIDDSAADRIFTDHLHGLAALISDAIQVRRQIPELDFLPHPKRQRKLLIELAGFDTQQRGGYRGDGDRRALRSHAQQSQRALFENLGVGRKALEWQYVDRGQKLRARLLAPGYQ